MAVDRDKLAEEILDLRLRIMALKNVLRAGEPLTDKEGPTAEGHIRSAITKLERRRAELLGR